jgi:GT2 family glycosyltransferase/tetratricopeptide (TPR) repeat protein
VLDEVEACAIEEFELAGRGPFDCVVWRHPEALPDPEAFLRRLRGWLAPGGHLVARFPTARHHARLGSLLDGTWGYEPAGPVPARELRFFTRREVEKLFSRGRFAVEALLPVPGPGHAQWERRGRPGEVRVGGLHVSGLAPDDAEEFHASAYLARASAAAPAGHGLTSIVLATHNQLDYTRLCVESVRSRTDEPYELVFVDNGSTDGTPDYLRGLAGARVICNPDNRGFPAAVNQGIAASSGTQVLLLNNDTVVTTGWLGRMLMALHRDPSVGLVGPCSNSVSGEQQVPAGYDDLSGLDGFAWDWGKARQGEAEDTDRLVGFCLLASRDLVDAVGPLDERFGTGCFEDDDYCLRALRAGWRAVIARDAFVHHFGGRTFAGSGVDFAALMERNRRLFRQKWEEENPAPAAASGGEVFGLVPEPGGRGLRLTRGRVGLSLCMIVRDNARTVRAALESVRPWVDEMVVVDTGSVDETPAIVASLGARLFHFPWRDSFAAARNESLRHARGEWVFWMDSDDTIDPDNGRRLRGLAARGSGPASPLGYVVSVHCPDRDGDGTGGYTRVTHVKLFRNLPGLRFEHRIHEQILPAILRAGGRVEHTGLFVVHSGYDTTPGGQARKLERDLRLLRQELAEQPDHPFTLYNLGMTYADVGRRREAAACLERSLARSAPNASHARKAYALLASCHAALGDDAAARDACERGLRAFPKDPELRFRRGVLLLARGEPAEAVRCFRDLLDCPDQADHYTSVHEGVNGHLARHNLALALVELGDFAGAERELRRATADSPGFAPAWRLTGELLLRQGREDEARRLADRLAAAPGAGPAGGLLRGRLALARGDLAGARQEYERAASAHPGDLEALGTLAQFLFEHVGVAEAEPALTALVRADPQDAAARHNLAAVYLQTGRPALAAEEFRESLRLRPHAPETRRQLAAALEGVGQNAEAR